MRFAFATCFNAEYQPGGLALCQSIRKQYPNPDEAPIVAMIEERYSGDPIIGQLKRLGVNIKQINVGPVVHDKPYREPWLKAKAWVTRYAFERYHADVTAHIDADAFLLAPIDDVLPILGDADLLGFEDPGPALFEYDVLYGTGQPLKRLSSSEVAFNCGVLFWRNTGHTNDALFDFCAAVNDGYTWAVERHDQFLLHDMIGRMVESGMFVVKTAPLAIGRHWNPVGKVAHDLQFKNGEWINGYSHERQYIWHGVGSGLPWRDHVSDGVQAAFRWATS